ncbi:F-box domain, Leucine-rich repeat domain, L domain-like protein [Artemisia annua]|uniref:F-box domain, Leucine-rich repeat domain, L domain-like protein n=1 Tax=Artemisia annua TaxID=35608 RepID=A0A2U1NW66_ARTAN|nr:F-box domain, Leucine-rich repeat domain, L domain-like protein [Artemisia annua]
MKNVEKSHVEDDSSSFDPLPDDILHQILNKLIDLKILCSCKLVSKRFFRIITKVDTISLITKHTSFNPFLSTIQSLRKFGGLKSLCIEIPPPREYPFLFKWKIKFGNKLDSFICLLPNTIYDNQEVYVNANGGKLEEEEEAMELRGRKHCVAVSCLMTAMTRLLMLLCSIKNIPLLETVSIMDCDKRWRVSASEVKVTEMRNDLTSPSESSYMRLEFGCRVSRCYVPMLELPVSGYVMKGVTLFLFERDDLPESEFDIFRKTVDADFEDKKEAAYCEALMEIFKNHMGRIERLNHLTTGVDF